MALISCTRATSPLDDKLLNADDEENEFYLSDYLLDQHKLDTIDNESMIVNNASLLELEEEMLKSNKSKQILIKRLLSRRRRRKVERRITIPTSTHLIDIIKNFKFTNHYNFSKKDRIITGTKSQFDISTIERRIELSELDRRNSIDDIKIYDETDKIERDALKNIAFDATTPPSTIQKKHYRSRSVPAPSIPQLTSTTTVFLKRKNGQQLGLGIAGGADRAISPTISFLRPGFIAHRCDQLQSGEKLLSVNNINLKGLTHEQILTVLRSAGDVVKLEVEYNLNHPVFTKPKNTMSKCTEIVLEKETGGFGFTIRGGSYGPDSHKCRPITVTAIRPGGPAHREGRLRVGDRIININGVDVYSATLGVAQKLIHDIDIVGKFIVEYDVSILETVKNATGPLMVEVDKTPGVDFGLSLVIKEKADPITNITTRGVFVDHVVPASISDRCGAIHEKDEILSIDGVGLEYTTLEEAMQLLKGHCSTVKLEIIPYSQMNKDESSRKSRRKHRIHDSNANHHKKKEEAKRSDSCDFQPQYGVRAVEQRAKSNERYMPQEKRKNSSYRFISNTVKHQKMNGLSGSVPSVPNTSNNIMSRSHDFTYADISRPSTSKLTASVSGTLFSAVPSGQVCHMETMEVFLQTQSSAKTGFGLILNRNDTKSTDADSGRYAPLFIAYIEKNSPADKCGVLQVGDRVLAINDWHTANSTVEEANHILRHANQSLTLTVEFDVIESVLPSSGIFTVKLAKRGNNLGIICRSETNGEKGEPVIISEIRTGSVAHRCGSIQRGDQIIAIDNISLESCTVEEAIRLMQRSGEVVKLSVKKCNQENQDLESSQIVVYSIELARKGQPLGITIASTGEKGDPIVISQLTSGGLAERTGALHVGDRILAINTENLDNKSVSEATQILHQANDIVALKISRMIDPPQRDHFITQYSPLSPLFSRTSRSLGTSFVHPLSTIRSDSVSEVSGKLSTPIQSIDSAVESLEDSPNNNSKNIQMASSCHMRLNDDLLHKRTTDTNGNRRSDQLIGSGRQNSSTSARSFSKAPSSSNDIGASSSVERAGWDSGLSSTGDTSHTANECCGCNNSTNNDTEDWKRILEALETVGEAEMLKKLEESIMSGNVPNKHSCQCSILSSSDDNKTNNSLLLRRNQQSSSNNIPGLINLNSTSTILKHPPLIQTNKDLYNDNNHQNTSYDGTLELPPAMPPPKPHINVSNNDYDTSPRRLSNLLMLLSDANNIPMIDATSPIHNDLEDYVTEKTIFSVHLKKDPNSKTFGFSVSDSATGIQGVYINALSSGSPADRCNKIKPFDRILKINETDIQDIGCNLAVPLLASDEVTLLLERTTIVSPNNTIKRKDNRGHTIQSAV